MLSVFSLFRTLPVLPASALLASAVALFVMPDAAFAQVPPPSRDQVFIEDTDAERAARQARIARSKVQVVRPKQGLDFQAPTIEFDREKNRISGKGGVLVSEGGVQVQADEGSFNMETREGSVLGNVVVTSPSGVLSADQANLNVPNETGDFSNLQFEVDTEGFQVQAEQARKLSEFEFDLDNSSLTSCKCPDGDKPWEVRSNSCSITQGAYAHTTGSSFYFEGLPVVYLPYLVFPVKNERASGLLPPRWGYSNRDGFMYNQPIFVAVDDSTDMTVTPFINTNSRLGSEVQAERIFSSKSTAKGGLLYSDESMRGSDPRGLNLKGVDDPTIDQQRLGGYYKQRWQSERGSEVPVEFIADGRYTSDNLFLREIPEPNIGDQRAQFLTSTAVMRATAFQAVSGEVRSEYNQMLLTDQDVQFQRVPEAALGAQQTFRPWGFNPYGLKLVTTGSAVATDFVRSDGYDGWRTDLRPRATVPFHVGSYVRGGASVELRQTQYSLATTTLPAMATPLSDGSTELDSSNSRTLPIFNYGMGTGVERVYEVERNSWFSKLTTLGAKNERTELARLKHTVEPSFSYTYVPDVDQSDLPLFDQSDRYRQRSLFGYGVTSRLYGRFLEPYERTRDIEELTASRETLPMFDLSSSVLDFGRSLVLAPPSAVDVRTGEIRELATFTVRQTYDYAEAKKDIDPNLDAFSDVNVGVAVSPSSYFSTGVQSNVSTSDGSLSSFQLAFGLRDDRDDALRARYTFIDGTLGQIEGNAELRLYEQLRAGYYARYDSRESELLENRGVFRFVNSCKCWSADLGLGKRVNPDNTSIIFQFTLGGLGNLTQGLGGNAGGSY